LICAATLLLFSLPTQVSSIRAAEMVRHHRRAHVVRADAVQTTTDAVELGMLAPPTRLGTLEQTYGDAAIARAHVQRAFDEPAPGPAALPGLGDDPDLCDPRTATAAGHVCGGGGNQALGYGQYYAFTPANVSAPQNVGRPHSEQDSMLPPATAFFWALDSFRYDPHN
jgi:hypothetical protein